MGRVGLAMGAASLLIAGLFAGTAQAANPAGWSLSVVQQPPIVQNGELAGFEITIANAGPSNISQFFYQDSPTATPAFVSIVGTRAYTCNSGADLQCNIGPMNAGDSVVITVAYTTPANGNSFSYVAEANTTGVPVGSNKSHGDSLFNNPKTVVTQLTTDKNIGGKFLPTGGDVSNDTNLSGSNKQSTQVFGVAAGVGAAVQDGLPNNAFDCGTACAGVTFLGEWSKIVVDNGRTQGTPFKVVITIKGAGNADLDSAVVYHVLDNGTTRIIGDTAEERCAVANAPNDPLAADGCIKAVKVGGNLQLNIWLTQNGGIRK